jgi:hypothetical protein
MDHSKRGKDAVIDLRLDDSSTIVKAEFSGHHLFCQSYSNRQFYFDLRKVGGRGSGG